MNVDSVGRLLVDPSTSQLSHFYGAFHAVFVGRAGADTQKQTGLKSIVRHLRFRIEYNQRPKNFNQTSICHSEHKAWLRVQYSAAVSEQE